MFIKINNFVLYQKNLNNKLFILKNNKKIIFNFNKIIEKKKLKINLIKINNIRN